MADNVIKRLVDAGVEFTGVSPAKAESLVRKLVRDGELRRRDAEAAIATLVGRGKGSAETFVISLQREISTQFDKLAARVDEVEQRVEEVLSTLVARTSGSPTPSGAASSPAATPPAKQSVPAKKAAVGAASTPAATRSAAKKAPAKKAPAKKAPAKKAAAKQSATTKSVATKSAARKPSGTGPSGVRRVSTSAR